jgi:tetraacyldisaccharide 4'-kinase
LSGIGDSKGFHRTAAEIGVTIAGAEAFRDHHRFSDADLDRVELEFRRSGATVLLTTEKDAVRLRSPRAQRLVKELPLHVVSIQQEFITDSGALESAILSAAHAR